MLFHSRVVYLSLPTSNHNLLKLLRKMRLLYIFRFLHQTTTRVMLNKKGGGCISFASYIKPQPFHITILPSTVVYLSLPTSNHNLGMQPLFAYELYIFRFLHQTTTHLLMVIILFRCISFASYIKPQLRTDLVTNKYVVYLSLPTSNHNPGLFGLLMPVLYIFRFLHQTTTIMMFTCLVL